MGNTQPQNKTGRKVVEQKFENAKKTGVLSLREHNLTKVPDRIYAELGPKLTTLDLSNNSIAHIDDNDNDNDNTSSKFATLKLLKSLNLDSNELKAGALQGLTQTNLPKLKTLSVNNNSLGRVETETKTKTSRRPAGRGGRKNQNSSSNNKSNLSLKNQNHCEPLPDGLPKGLKTILLSNNHLSMVPKSIIGPSNMNTNTSLYQLTVLEKLDLSYNNLITIPTGISNLINLTEFNLDSNVLVSLPNEIGRLTKLKILSLRKNHISGNNTNTNTTTATTIWNATTNPQPLPQSLFTDTLLIDLNLHDNQNLTSTQLNSMDGYDTFLERRRRVKNKDLMGGALTDLDTCGLK